MKRVVPFPLFGIMLVAGILSVNVSFAISPGLWSSSYFHLAKNEPQEIASEMLLAGSSTYFSVGAGGSDVIPHQLVRTNTDYLYIIVNQQSSNMLRVYRTTGSGLPATGSDFATPILLTLTGNPISVDAVYDGGNIIHTLVNTQDGKIQDYPFNTTTNSFRSPTTLATNGGTVTSGLYVGTSGVAGMVDLNGLLHVVYWTNQNRILHGAFTYNSSMNVLTPNGGFFTVDTAGGANHPSVAVSPLNNSLTVAWVSEADNPPKIRTRARAGNGTWGNVQIASTASVWTSTENGINIDQGPSLIVDTSGTRHLVYIQSFDGSAGDYGRIHYVTDTGSGWVDNSLSAFSHDPALAINSAGEIYIIGHGHPKNTACLSMLDMCVIKKNSNGTWGNPQLFALHPGSNSFDSSPSVKWSAVGFNRPDLIEFIFFSTPYDSPTMYYGRIQSGFFQDVPANHPYHDEIEILYANGYTAGCSTNPLKFCPDVIMNRAQAAVFMLRGNFGSGYVPVTPTHFFADNWVNAPWGEGWAESMYLEGLTAGCSPSPLKFCPDDQLINVQAAVFGLRLKYGIAYTPPAATGTVFADLTDVNFWGTGWAEQAYADGLIPACGTSGGKPMFCANNLVSRGFGAYIIVLAKSLVMP